MKEGIKYELERIARQYNAEHDTNPDGPRVTWAEYILLQAVKALAADFEELARRVEHAGL